MKISNVSIIENPKIQDISGIRDNLEKIIQQMGAKVIPCSMDTDILISLGGDGTVLKGFKMLPSFDIPLLGLNFGKFGFLTIDCKDMKKVMQNVFSGSFRISPRMYLEGNIIAPRNEMKFAGRALNEMILFRKDIRMVEFELTLGSTVFYFRADGMIISTPTGSTAHAFSAGGPIVFPESRSIIVVAFAPFTATWRNCIYEGRRLTLKPSRDCDIIIDGQERIDLQKQQLLEIKPGQESFKLMVPENWDFWNTLKEKFSWGKGLI
ncbi:MAG TPA: NAD(+)/NADH kinase [bacterium]|nr:NAD(+)/NADH kinase [bacterium]HOL34303.1 NAD(+)/NADH kinase [bacterium]HPP08609.1 NAD(+)/NADH kinase [bacterium]